jgi:hypothetical protein
VESWIKPTLHGASADPLFHGFEMAARTHLRVTGYDTKVVKFTGTFSKSLGRGGNQWTVKG